MGNKFIYTFIAAALLGQYAPVFAAAPNASDSKQVTSEYNNIIDGTVTKPDYETIASDLASKLQLDKKQEKQLRKALVDQDKKFQDLQDDFNYNSRALSDKRDQLLKLRDEHKRTVSEDNYSQIIMQKLELDQKSVYQRKLQEDKAAQAAEAAIASSSQNQAAQNKPDTAKAAPEPAKNAKKSVDQLPLPEEKPKTDAKAPGITKPAESLKPAPIPQAAAAAPGQMGPEQAEQLAPIQETPKPAPAKKAPPKKVLKKKPAKPAAKPVETPAAPAEQPAPAPAQPAETAPAQDAPQAAPDQTSPEPAPAPDEPEPAPVEGN